MISTIEEPIGFYITCDDALDVDCFEAEGGLESWLERGGFESWEEPIPIGETFESAADSPTHCKRCEQLIAHPLTNDGLDYVRQAFEEQDGSGRPCIRKQWALTYLDDEDLGEQLSDEAKALVESWPDRDDLSPVFVVWHGGQGYSHSSIAEELEWFETTGKAKDALVKRYQQGAWSQQQIQYLNRPSQLVYTPVDSVPEDTSMDVYYTNPTLSRDPHPDQRWTLDADSNVTEEAA